MLRKLITGLSLEAGVIDLHFSTFQKINGYGGDLRVELDANITF